MPLDVAERPKSTMSRRSATSTFATTVWPTVDVPDMMDVFRHYVPTQTRRCEGEPLATAATGWLAMFELLKRLGSAKGEAQSNALLRDLGSDRLLFSYGRGTAPTTSRRPLETGLQADGWQRFLEGAVTDQAPPTRYPILRAALDTGQLEAGAGLPTPGHRPLRIVEEEPGPASVDEQVQFGTPGLLPTGRVRRRRLR